MSDFLGQGWRFPIRPDATGRLGYVSGDENVVQSVVVLLSTAVEERVMRPSFGTEAPRLVFAPGSTQYLGLLEQTVRDAVRDQEPRVILESVEVVQDPIEPERVSIEVGITVRRSNTRTSVVFPYYLPRSEGVL